MEESIDLRELVLIIKKGKCVIAGVTYVTVIIASILSLFILKSEYSSLATISINNGIISGSVPSITDSYFSDIITPTLYVKRVNSTEIKWKAFKKSGLNNYSITGFNAI